MEQIIKKSLFSSETLAAIVYLRTRLVMACLVPDFKLGNTLNYTLIIALLFFAIKNLSKPIKGLSLKF